MVQTLAPVAEWLFANKTASNTSSPNKDQSNTKVCKQRRKRRRKTVRLAAVSALGLLAGLPVSAFGQNQSRTPLGDWVDPFLGTAPLTTRENIGHNATWRVWAGLTYPGATLPNAMVQLSPITEFGSGAGYEYEDEQILAFAHTNKGHWNLCHLPVLPISGELQPNWFSSPYSHDEEDASPGYYEVKLKRYGIHAELTSTPHVGFHRYTYEDATTPRSIVFDLGRANEGIREFHIEQIDDHTVAGFQRTGEKICFYATFSEPIVSLETVERRRNRPDLNVVAFAPGDKSLEMQLAMSFVSTDNAKMNLEAEASGKTFDQVKIAAAETWEALLEKAQVTGGTDNEKRLFYSSLYRTFQWPALRSDVNGEFVDGSGKVVNKGFKYYRTPSLWDTYRNKLVLLSTMTPDVAEDVIQSMIDLGQHRGHMPTFFHGDHGAPFISGAYLRGLRGFDVDAAYELLKNNATQESRRGRPHVAEYIEKGYISTPEVENPHVESKAKAGVTKTLEYAYDDFSLALLADELGKTEDAAIFRARSQNYKNLFDPTTGFMRGKLANGDWVEPFDAEYPYYEYMYREANAWNSTFFAPHDTDGLVALFPSKDALEAKLDELFTKPWNPNHIARNISGFIGQYCHGNQPAHTFPWLYYWVGKQEKTQARLNQIMATMYGMEDNGRALCGMDDSGEMSAWYVCAALGLYPYSPGEAEYIVSVPLFDTAKVWFNGDWVTVNKQCQGDRITGILLDGKPVDGFFVSDAALRAGKTLTIQTAD